jgi:hypothetical protein
MNLVAKRFPIRFSPFMSVLVALLGIGPRNSYVGVTDDELDVRMGWMFRACIPRASIGTVGERGYVWWAYGVHGNGGRWIVNGSGHNIVTIRIEPPVGARVLGVPIRLRELWVSLEDPSQFRAAIGR